MSCSPFRRAVAGALVVAIAAAVANLPAVAASNALFRGRVLDADGVTPRAGVVVALLDVEKKQSFESAPADDRGYFRIDAAPAGSYAVVARAKEGAFLAASSVALSPGENKPLALSLKSAGSGGAAGGGGAAAATRTAISTWMKWVIVGGIAVGSLVVADAVSKSENPSSPL
jgi:hypothetical protein